MCVDGGLGVLAGMSLLSAGLSTAQQVAAQESQYQQQQNQNNIMLAQQQTEAAMRAQEAALNYKNLDNQQIEIDEAAAQEKSEIAKEADERRALQRAAASYNGTSSDILDRLEGELLSDESSDIAAVEANRAAQTRQNIYERDAAHQRSQVAPAYLSTPTKASTGMTLLSGAVSGLTNTYRDISRYY